MELRLPFLILLEFSILEDVRLIFVTNGIVMDSTFQNEMACFLIVIQHKIWRHIPQDSNLSTTEICLKYIL